MEQCAFVGAPYIPPHTPPLPRPIHRSIASLQHVPFHWIPAHIPPPHCQTTHGTRLPNHSRHDQRPSFWNYACDRNTIRRVGVCRRQLLRSLYRTRVPPWPSPLGGGFGDTPSPTRDRRKTEPLAKWCVRWNVFNCGRTPGADEHHPRLHPVALV